ncbi:MAG: MFS transporter [Candidatus Eremiobacteraeota bacterium]|nr:MFS transporter [Candidatus Eremiobacteraeota bacterium]
MKPRPPVNLGRLHYAWVVAATAFVVLIVVAGIRATPGVLMTPIERDMGWSAQTISAAAAINITLYGLVGPFAAALMQTFGLRRTMVLGLAIVACGVLSAGFSREPWQLILTWGVIAGTGVGTLAMVLAATIANRWFSTKRGLVTGALTAATATGQLIFLPVLAATAERVGWRSATWIVASAAVLAIVPVVVLIRDRPADVGLLPYGATEFADVGRSSGNPLTVAFGALRRASKSSSFWILAGTFFICGASTNGLIGTHFIAACGDYGIPELKAASLLAAMGIFDLIGTTASGWLSDRLDNRLLLFTYYGLRGLSLLFLPEALASSFAGLSIFTVFYGLDWIATVPPTVRLATQTFGTEEAPIVFGWISAAHQLGAGAIAFGAGTIRTQFASYTPAFEISGVLCIGAAFAILTFRNAKRAVPALA